MEKATLIGTVHYEKYRPYYGNKKMNLWFEKSSTLDSSNNYLFIVDGLDMSSSILTVKDLRKDKSLSGDNIVATWLKNNPNNANDTVGMIEMIFGGSSENTHDSIHGGKFNIPSLTPECCYSLQFQNPETKEIIGGETLYNKFRQEVDSNLYTGGKVQVLFGPASFPTVVNKGMFEVSGLTPMEKGYSVKISDPIKNVIIGYDTSFSLEGGINKIDFYVRNLADTIRVIGKKKDTGVSGSGSIRE